MAILTDIRQEVIQTMIGTVTDLAAIFTGAKIGRYNFLDLIEKVQKAEQGGMEPRYGVVSFEEQLPASLVAMDSANWENPIKLSVIRTTEGTQTTVTTGANSITQAVASSAGFAVGDLVYFVTAKAARTVVSIPDGTHVTFNSAVTTTTNEKVHIADASRKLEDDAQALATAFGIGKPFTNFQIFEDPITHMGEESEINEILLAANFPLQAVTVTIYPSAGQYL